MAYHNNALVPVPLTASGQQPTGRRNTALQLTPPTLLCNLCQKSLATTCFLCACDCIFCEECTYSHFESSSQCPVCKKELTENDFTELVVADGTSTESNNSVKTSIQALFSRQSQSTDKGLPLSDLCFSLIRQIDVVKRSTKFLLKQLLMDNNRHERKLQGTLRSNEALKNDIAVLKKVKVANREQYEQFNKDLKNRLFAKESHIKELQRKLTEKDVILGQFRQFHNKLSTQNTIADSTYHNDGITMKSRRNHVDSSLSNQHRARHQYAEDLSLTMNGSSMKRLLIQKPAEHDSYTPIKSGTHVPGVFYSAKRVDLSGRVSSTQHTLRPFSVNSVRDLSSSSGFHFSGTDDKRLNKRRRRNLSAIKRNSLPSTPFSMKLTGSQK